MTSVSSAPLAVDFGHGIHPLVEWFRSLTFFVDADESGRITGPNLDALAGWIDDWDRWCHQASGMDRGRRLHLVYSREVSVASPLQLQQWDQVRQLPLACEGVDVVWGLTLDGHDAADHLIATKERLAERLFQGVCFSFDVTRPLPASAREMVANALALNLNVTIAGAVDQIVAEGLLSADGIRGRHLALEPVLGVPIRDSLHRIEPCARRFRVFVDSAGDVYPCTGLVGLRQLRLGNIEQPFARSVFRTKASLLDLKELAEGGPTLDLSSPTNTTSSCQPVLCQRHRAQLASVLENSPTNDQPRGGTHEQEDRTGPHAPQVVT